MRSRTFFGRVGRLIVIGVLKCPGNVFIVRYTRCVLLRTRITIVMLLCGSIILIRNLFLLRSNPMDDKYLKRLRTQIKELKNTSSGLRDKIKYIERQRERVHVEINNIQKRIDKIEIDKTIRVSEHALLRYIERVKNIDLKEAESEIVTDKLKEYVDTLGGTGSFPVGNYKVILKNYNVVTVI
jgi:low affinity Fe/Cu permease